MEKIRNENHISWKGKSLLEAVYLSLCQMWSLLYTASLLGALVPAGAFECTSIQSVELFMLLDSTVSFRDYLPRARTVIPFFLERLSTHVQRLSAGLAYFGDHGKLYDRPNDECFREVIPLTTDLEAVIGAAAYLQSLYDGGDPPDASISAMAYAAGTAAGFSTPEERNQTVR